MKELIFNNTKYKISDTIWKKHLSMHPIRPDDALYSNMRIVFGNEKITNTDIEELIENEFLIQSNFAGILEKAEDVYDSRYSKD